jgi:hypothetical protein
MEKKAKILLDRIIDRIDSGEFDEHLDIPFASRNLLKSLVTSKIENKIENKTTPVLSDRDIFECVGEVRETAAYTASAFHKIGILKRNGDKIELDSEWEAKLSRAQK